MLSLTILTAFVSLASAVQQLPTDCEVLNGGIPSIPATGKFFVYSNKQNAATLMRE
jgi:hypothetical protein